MPIQRLPTQIFLRNVCQRVVCVGEYVGFTMHGEAGGLLAEDGFGRDHGGGDSGHVLGYTHTDNHKALRVGIKIVMKYVNIAHGRVGPQTSH